MKIEERVNAFHNLGKAIQELSKDEFQSIALSARQENAWFTDTTIQMAVSGLLNWLNRDALSQWIANYTFPATSKKIAVVMAGNIPLVGFHDFLSILISGHSILIKPSSKDSILLKYLVNKLISIEPKFQDKIEYAEQLKGFDAIIATGSDNASRYFEYYFSKYPHIIRKNRTSVAILSGRETDQELHDLGTDIFTYFGLGCRNVSKIFVPEGYAIESLFPKWTAFREIIHHHKYANNYDYQKSILLITGALFLDDGMVMLQENQKLFSPLAVVYYEFYKDKPALLDKLSSVTQQIQCVVGNTEPSKIKFGQAQFPMLQDYADQIDTLKFLSELVD